MVALRRCVIHNLVRLCASPRGSPVMPPLVPAPIRFITSTPAVSAPRLSRPDAPGASAAELFHQDTQAHIYIHADRGSWPLQHLRALRRFIARARRHEDLVIWWPGGEKRLVDMRRRVRAAIPFISRAGGTPMCRRDGPVAPGGAHSSAIWQEVQGGDRRLFRRRIDDRPVRSVISRDRGCKGGQSCGGIRSQASFGPNSLAPRC